MGIGRVGNIGREKKRRDRERERERNRGTEKEKEEKVEGKGRDTESCLFRRAGRKREKGESRDQLAYAGRGR